MNMKNSNGLVGTRSYITNMDKLEIVKYIDQNFDNDIHEQIHINIYSDKIIFHLFRDRHLGKSVWISKQKCVVLLQWYEPKFGFPQSIIYLLHLHNLHDHLIIDVVTNIYFHHHIQITNLRHIGPLEDSIFIIEWSFSER
jgi:hypothetical protein